MPVTSTQEAYRRAGGRRRYNTQRKWDRRLREMRVRVLLLRAGAWAGGWVRRGALAEIARKLNCNRSTICRDVKRLQQEVDCPEHGSCPVCGQTFDVKARRLQVHDAATEQGMAGRKTEREELVDSVNAQMTRDVLDRFGELDSAG